jgi:predicted Ser/Thr protein kinase
MSSALKVCPTCNSEYPASERFCPRDGTALRAVGGETDMVGSIIADRYHVMRKLGEGGMGQVYLVEHVKMGRKSALKVMNPGMVKDADAISRFNREAANASRINHPNVAAVYDFGETPDGIIYLAMEFVEGPPLTKVIEQQGALPPKRAAEIVRQAAEALAIAHDMGIVHRDLKPDNIMIAKTRDGGDLVKVVDFGIAKAAGAENQKVTKTGLVVGTPEYMSPEQLAGDKLDGRSDIYSLGLVAFNMMTGKLPFPSDSAQESMIMRLTDKPKPLGEMKPDLTWPADVQAVMDKALERDVNARYQTATEFGRALYQAVDRMPMTQAAEVGTQVLAVPATRVSEAGGGERGAASAGATAIVGAPATAKKKSMAPLVGGIAAVVVLGGGAWVVINKSGTKPPPTDTGKGTLNVASNVAAPEGKTEPLSKQSPAPAGSPGITADPFTRLEQLAKDSVTAKDAMTGVAAIRATSDEQRVRVAYVRFLAKQSLGIGDYCNELKVVADIAPKTSKGSVVASNLKDLCSE